MYTDPHAARARRLFGDADARLAAEVSALADAIRWRNVCLAMQTGSLSAALAALDAAAAAEAEMARAGGAR